MDTDVLIIGGGIIGISTAYYLAHQGTAVTVIDKGDLGSINQRRVKAILRAAESFLTPVGEPEIVEIWRGMRPCLPDGLPVIGRARRPSNLLIGTGHSTLGLSLGPITGQLLAELVLAKQPSLPLHPFQIERFS